MWIVAWRHLCHAAEALLSKGDDELGEVVVVDRELRDGYVDRADKQRIVHKGEVHPDLSQTNRSWCEDFADFSVAANKQVREIALEFYNTAYAQMLMNWRNVSLSWRV